MTTTAEQVYYQLRGEHVAAGGTVPDDVRAFAAQGEHAEAVIMLRQLLRDAAHMAQLTRQVLTAFAADLDDAVSTAEILHLERRAEGLYATDLGRRMRDLVDAARRRRTRRTVTMHLHISGCRSAICDGPTDVDQVLADEVMLLLGPDTALACMRRWETLGYAGDWRNVQCRPVGGAR